MSDSGEVDTVALPAELVARIEDRAKRTEFEDASAYLTHVLEEILYRIEEENDLSTAEAVEERQVRQRLESLGYLNE